VVRTKDLVLFSTTSEYLFVILEGTHSLSFSVATSVFVVNLERPLIGKSALRTRVTEQCKDGILESINALPCFFRVMSFAEDGKPIVATTVFEELIFTASSIASRAMLIFQVTWDF
jgi:hypothetical protein